LFAFGKCFFNSGAYTCISSGSFSYTANGFAFAAAYRSNCRPDGTLI
jgi:hypothetical protein